jgi:hypothetical protein
MTTRAAFSALAFLWLSLAAASCGNGGADFSTRFASGYVPAPHTVSLLGVYQDGRMSLDTWPGLAPYFTRALGSASCPEGYDALVASNQDLANAVDEFSRNEGPTANLLKQLAPAAQGDLILVVTFAGKVPEQREDPTAHPSPGTPSMGQPRKHGRRNAGAAQPGAARDTNQLDISAALYSVTEKRSVALIGMQYHGESVDDALKRFGVQLSTDMPSLKCVGWRWDAPIDPSQIHANIAE